MIAAFSVSIFLAAGLLFSVQPMSAKPLLPLLGGSPAVWNTSMLFFQSMLLAGYVYAHALGRLWSVRRQLIVHALVLCASLAFLPIGLPAGLQPDPGAFPASWMLLTLLTSVGGPFFVLASSTPLLQSWLAGTTHRAAKDPYFLYAASNAGSFVALLAYPFWIEPALGVADQTLAWSGVYGLFAVSIVGCGVVATRARAEPGGVDPSRTGKVVAQDVVAVTHGSRLWWVALGFAPCSLMLGTTQHLATDVASFPWLWVGPLAIYLLTFVVAFARWGRPFTRAAEVLAPFVLLGLAVLLGSGLRSEILPQVIAYPVGLLVVGLACHGLLAERRPAVNRLTEFYLLLSLGGVLAGGFNALVAPLVFESIAEFPVAIGLCCLVVMMGQREMPEAGGVRARVLMGLAPLFVLGAWPLVRLASQRLQLDSAMELWSVDAETWWQVLIPAAVCGLFLRNRRAFVLGFVAYLGATHIMQSADDVLFRERTFFGVHQVVDVRMADGGSWHLLDHGSTRHGAQYYPAQENPVPTTYYTRSGPLGDVVRALNGKPGPKSVAAVGLGSGTIAAHAQDGWKLTFYEIDPVVVQIASNPEYFSFISDCAGLIDFEVGDARLRIAEAEDGDFDMIVLDAYASDAVPVHLITLEAVDLYLRKLAPGGMLLFHVTNMHLDLVPVLAGIVDELDLLGALRVDDDEGSEVGVVNKYASDWVVVVRGVKALGRLASDSKWSRLEPAPDGERVLWTDDRSDLLSVLVW